MTNEKPASKQPSKPISKKVVKQPSKRNKKSTTLKATDIETYLTQHPDFFHDHLDLLTGLNVPHPSGKAISLIEKQVELLRGRSEKLQSQLITLVDIAKENHATFRCMHKLALVLMEATTLADVCTTLEKIFTELFVTDFIALRVIKDNNFISNATDHPCFIDADDDSLRHFSNILNANKSRCGKPTLAQAKFLFGNTASEVQSCAIIPMSFTQLEGIVAIASRDKSRFDSRMGDLFLTQISEIVAIKLIAVCR